MNLPNKLTMTRIIMIPFFLLFIIPLPKEWETVSFIRNFNEFVNQNGKFVAGAIFIVAAITDLLDGYIARSRKIITTFGKFLDPIADKLLVSAALIALIQVRGLNGWFLFIILAREFIVTGIRLLAAAEGKIIAANIWGKIKTVSQIFAILLILFENYPFSEFSDIDAGGIMIIIAVITTIVSGYDVVKKNIDILKNNK